MVSKNIQNQNTVVDGNIVPEVDDAYDIGSEQYRFRNAYLASAVDFNAGESGTSMTLKAATPVLPVQVMMPDPGIYNANLIYDVVDQTITAQKTFTSNINMTNRTPGLNLQPNATGFFLSLVGSPIAIANRVIALPNPGQNGNVLYDVSAQTIPGQKTFTNGLTSPTVTCPSGEGLILAAPGVVSPNSGMIISENGNVLFETQQTANGYCWFVSNLVIGSSGSNYCTMNGVLNALNGLINQASLTLLHSMEVIVVTNCQF